MTGPWRRITDLTPGEIFQTKTNLFLITKTKRYGKLLGQTCSSCGGFRLWARGFWSLGQKRLIMLFLLILGHFWCFLVP